MNTKFILHGGVAGPQTGRNRAFYQEAVKDLPNPKVLCIHFARDESEWDYLFLRDITNFQWANPQTFFRFDRATRKDLVVQMRRSDVIYISGGDTVQLLETMRSYGGFVEALRGRVVAGSSAGAYLFSQWYNNHQDSGVSEGLGVVPAKMFGHYKPAKDSEFWLSDAASADMEQQLKACPPPESELLLLREQDYEVRLVRL